MRRLLHGLLGATLLLGACGDDDGDRRAAAVTSIPEETTTSTSSTTTEPRTVSPDVIPQDVDLITEEYVEQVLNELYNVANEALRLTMTAGLVDQQAIELIEATSSKATTTDDINALLDLSYNQFPGFRSEPQPLRAEIVGILQASRDCVLAEISVDRSGPLLEPPESDPGTRSFVRLLPATSEQLATGANPTAWVTDGLPTTSDGSTPSAECSE